MWFTLCLVISCLSAPLIAQDSIHFVPSDRVAVRVMREVSSIELAPRVNVRTVVGATGSFSIGDFEPGTASVLHHHTREQADVGVSGVFDVIIGNHSEPLGPGAGVIIPPNVSHSIANKGDRVMTVIEFHTVRRPDLVPPRPAMTFSSSLEPVAVPDERRIVKQLDQSNGARVVGETCTLAWRRLEKGAAPTEVHGAGIRTELFVYIVRGEARLTVAGRDQRVSAGSLVVIPAAQHGVQLQAMGGIDAAIVEFSPERR